MDCKSEQTLVFDQCLLAFFATKIRSISQVIIELTLSKTVHKLINPLPAISPTDTFTHFLLDNLLDIRIKNI